MSPFGDRALRFTIPTGAPRRRLGAELSTLPGVTDVVLTEEIGCVVFGGDVNRDAVERELARAREVAEDEPGTTHVIPVVYDGDDLDEVANAIGQSKEEVIRLHSGGEYRVAMLGFLPGFAYLRGLPEALRLPRRAPRPRVPAGSVAIAADYTGIYPFASPGGWHLLGRAASFEAFGANGAALAIGDAVRFTPASDHPIAAPPPPIAPRLACASSERPHLEISRAAGFGLLVDGGRPGRMHEGVPPGGPLVRSLLTRANALAGNDPAACAIELVGTFEVVARGGTVLIADDDAPRALAEGERHVVSTAGRSRVRYLALSGGIDAPVVLGGRGALPVAGIGGLLRKGDRLTPSSEATKAQNDMPSSAPPAVGADEVIPSRPIAIMPGPDTPPGFSLDAITSTELRIAAASDRTGTRLEGTPLLLELGAHTRAMTRPSTPMVIGAIELTPSGLIVLGPDHPTTGGYPVVAVVRLRALDPLFSLPIGASLRFVVDESRA